MENCMIVVLKGCRIRMLCCVLDNDMFLLLMI